MIRALLASGKREKSEERKSNWSCYFTCFILCGLTVWPIGTSKVHHISNMCYVFGLTWNVQYSTLPHNAYLLISMNRSSSLYDKVLLPGLGDLDVVYPISISMILHGISLPKKVFLLPFKFLEKKL